MIKTKIKASIVALIIGLQALIVPIASADYLPVRAYGNDTVAGYASGLKTSLINPAQNVVFVVEKPDLSVIRIPAQADLEGIAEADLYGHQTKIAGDYKVAVLFPGSVDSSPQETFKVYPDQVSTTQSDLSSTSQMLTADGEEKSFITVTLFDAYRNPIKNHQVQLISSRQEDQISVINGGVTDEHGRANFKVTSKYSGISVFTAMDATVNRVLTDREEIVFYAPTKNDYAFGGNTIITDLLRAEVTSAIDEVLPGPVHHFDIEDLPSTIKVNTDQTLTIVARDKDGNVAKNYTSTILISTPDDEHAVLPNNGEYTFKESDQGKFTFNLALRLTQLGNQAIQVLDKSNWKISGEYLIEVIPEKAVVVGPTSASLMIKSPVDGAELGNSLVIITGQGDPNINLKVFDNDTKIGDTETDSDGFLSFQAQNLISGSHLFYLMSEKGDVSASVSVQIDTLPPVLNSFEIYPDGIVTAGTSLTVTATSEPGLDEVKIRLQGISESLFPSDPGTYTANIAAPVIEGSYPIDVILIDSLSNKAELLNKAMVVVVAKKDILPPTVEGLTGEGSDSLVDLTWEEVKGHETGIQKYKIYYGTVFDKLDKLAETDDSATSLTIDGFENDTQYFFAVTAIDSKGLESEEKSVVIAITPVTPVDETVDELVAEPTVDPVTGQIIYPTDTQIPVLPGTIQATATQNTITLRWTPFLGTQAYFYKMYFGLISGRYDDYIITPNSIPNLVIRDLIPQIPYYFAVVALDITGREISPLSAELSVMPGGTSYHSAPPQIPTTQPTYTPTLDDKLANVPSNDETGPETIWIILISVFAAYVFYNHKKKVIQS